MALIEIAASPINSMGIFHGYVSHNQMVFFQIPILHISLSDVLKQWLTSSTWFEQQLLSPSAPQLRKKEIHLWLLNPDPNPHWLHTHHNHYIYIYIVLYIYMYVLYPHIRMVMQPSLIQNIPTKITCVFNTYTIMYIYIYNELCIYIYRRWLVG